MMCHSIRRNDALHMHILPGLLCTPRLLAVYPSSPLACYATSCTVACTVPLPMSLLCTYHTQLLKCGTYSWVNFCAMSYVCIFWLNQRCNILLKPTFNRLITSNRLSSHIDGRATGSCSDTAPVFVTRVSPGPWCVTHTCQSPVSFS